MLVIAVCAGLFATTGFALSTKLYELSLPLSANGAFATRSRKKPLPLHYTGINIASGGFASQHIPGRYGYDYFYPLAKEVSPFLAAGMNAVRVPFLWERIQPSPNAPLDPVELARLDTSIAELAGFRLIILDVHNYAKYRGQRLDLSDPQGAMLADLWTRLARHYSANTRIAFGLMNEPNGLSAMAWQPIAAASLRAIRSTGARNLILVPGTRWSSAYAWTTGGSESNGQALRTLVDPVNNMAFEMHQYPDSDSSGTHPTCVSPVNAARSFDAATAWLRANHARGFLGEFGASKDPNCLAALDAMLSALDDAPDVWLGWTYWAGGAMWGSYMYSVQPDGTADKPQFSILVHHLAR
jgi:endoglucanase